MSILKIQTNLNDFGVIKEQIERSKIKRYPYNKILGVSLTEYILRYKGMDLSSSQVLGNLLRNSAIREFIEQNQDEKDNILKNLKISVCSRFAEESSRKRYR